MSKIQKWEDQASKRVREDGKISINQYIRQKSKEGEWINAFSSMLLFLRFSSLSCLKQLRINNLTSLVTVSDSLTYCFLTSGRAEPSQYFFTVCLETPNLQAIEGWDSPSRSLLRYLCTCPFQPSHLSSSCQNISLYFTGNLC